jgi:hypothetical protein
MPSIAPQGYAASTPQRKKQHSLTVRTANDRAPPPFPHQAHFAAARPEAPHAAAAAPTAAEREAALAAILGPSVPPRHLAALLARNGNNVGRAADEWFRTSPAAEAPGGGGGGAGAGTGGGASPGEIVLSSSGECCGARPLVPPTNMHGMIVPIFNRNRQIKTRNQPDEESEEDAPSMPARRRAPLERANAVPAPTTAPSPPQRRRRGRTMAAASNARPCPAPAPVPDASPDPADGPGPHGSSDEEYEEDDSNGDGEGSDPPMRGDCSSDGSFEGSEDEDAGLFRRRHGDNPWAIPRFSGGIITPPELLGPPYTMGALARGAFGGGVVFGAAWRQRLAAQEGEGGAGRARREKLPFAKLRCVAFGWVEGAGRLNVVF